MPASLLAEEFFHHARALFAGHFAMGLETFHFMVSYDGIGPMGGLNAPFLWAHIFDVFFSQSFAWGAFLPF